MGVSFSCGPIFTPVRVFLFTAHQMPHSGLEGHTGLFGVQTGQSEWAQQAIPIVMAVLAGTGMEEIKVGDDTQLFHPLKICLSRAETMLNAVPWIRPRILFHGLFYGIDCHSDPIVTLGMDGSLIA